MPAFDAVVVGAGAGGAAATWRMIERGWCVLLLDAGPAFDPGRDYVLHLPDWERRGFPHKPGSQGEVSFAPMQALDSVTHAGLMSWSRGQGQSNRSGHRAVSGAGYHHVRGIGGSTLHFVGEAHRLHPGAMALRSRHGVGADWPLDYAVLEPYYLQVEQLIGVAGPAETGVRWRSGPYPYAAHPLCKASRRLGEGAARLGLSWSANPRAVLPLAQPGRAPCNYCGGCTRGCPRGDKGSVDVTFIARARASGRCEVRAGYQVLQLIPGPRHRIAAIVAAGPGGQRVRIDTPRLVLACGAIETPRLLLAQRDIALPSRHVGRHLLESVGWTSIGRAEDPLDSFGGLPADAICWDYNAPDAVPGVVGGYRLSTAIHESALVGAVAHAQRAIAGFGRAHKQAMRHTVGHLVAVGAGGESLPSEDNYVDLDPQRRDANGMPLARIHSRVDEMTVRRLRAMAASCRALLAASGAGELVEEYGSYDHFSAAHVFGTCRMAPDARVGVVDEALRVHGMDNLWITDASVFPSSGGGEAPSLTIQALALRAVDRMTD